MCPSRVARHKIIIKNEKKEERGSNNTKLQKVNNMYNGTWPITTTNKGENGETENEKQTKRGGDAVAAAWPVACSLCLRLYCCSTRCRAACTTPRGISRQNAKNVFTTKATQAAGSSNATQRLLLCSLLVPLMDLQHFE